MNICHMYLIVLNVLKGIKNPAWVWRYINKCRCHGLVTVIHGVYPAVPGHRLWQQLMSWHIFLCQCCNILSYKSVAKCRPAFSCESYSHQNHMILTGEYSPSYPSWHTEWWDSGRTWSRGVLSQMCVFILLLPTLHITVTHTGEPGQTIRSTSAPLATKTLPNMVTSGSKKQDGDGQNII